MTWLSRIAFSLLLAGSGACAEVRGTVRMSHSRVPAVRKGADYSGVVVWLEPAGSAAHPTPPAGHATMDQIGKRFIPHIMAVQLGTKVNFPNNDPIFHNAFSNFSGQVFDFGLYAPGTSREVTFTKPGVVRVFCNIHPAMSAVIVVLRYRWFAVSDQSGSFAIHDVPPGEYRLHVFHERATEDTLLSLDRRIHVGDREVALPPMEISEIGYIEGPHKNKYGVDYAPLAGDGAYPAGRK